MSQVDSKTLVAVVGIAAVVILESIAMYQGINGTYLSVAIGAVTTIIGFVYGYKKGQKA